MKKNEKGLLFDFFIAVSQGQVEVNHFKNVQLFWTDYYDDGNLTFVNNIGKSVHDILIKIISIVIFRICTTHLISNDLKPKVVLNVNGNF